MQCSGSAGKRNSSDCGILCIHGFTLPTFIAIGIVWTLANCTVRKLEKGGDENSDAATTIEFGELQKINPDIVAWIRIDGLGIDYPVVQGRTMNIICIIRFGAKRMWRAASSLIIAIKQIFQIPRLFCTVII